MTPFAWTDGGRGARRTCTQPLGTADHSKPKAIVFLTKRLWCNLHARSSLQTHFQEEHVETSCLTAAAPVVGERHVAAMECCAHLMIRPACLHQSRCSLAQAPCPLRWSWGCAHRWNLNLHWRQGTQRDAFASLQTLDSLSNVILAH